MGEEKMSMYSSTIPSTCFFFKERIFVEATVVEATFFLL
jgi:hypothetical protein